MTKARKSDSLESTERFRQVMGRMEASAFLRLTGLRVTGVAAGTATVELEVTEKLLQTLGIMHGGMLGGLIDTAIGVAVFGALRGKGHVATIEYKVNFYRPGRLGDVLTAHAEVLHLGRATAAGQARVVDQDGNLVGHGTATFMRVTQSLDPTTASSKA